jgi:hypothetical protein
MADRSPSFWDREIPDAPPGFFQFELAAFELTRGEAEWLCERIISADRSSRGGAPGRGDVGRGFGEFRELTELIPT